MVIYILHDCVILLESPLIWKKIEKFLTSLSSLYCTLCCSMSLWTMLAHYNSSGVEPLWELNAAEFDKEWTDFF